MSRYDSNAETVGTRFARWNRPAVVVTAVAILSSLIERRGRWVSDPAVFRFTVIDFNSDVLGIDRPEMDACAHLKRFSHGDALAIFIADLQVIDTHLRPVFAHTCFPFA